MDTFPLQPEIYYFSGTGNSFVVARDVAKRLSGTLVPIASLPRSGSITPEGDVVGIVFPVYYGVLPCIVKDFAERLTAIEGKYVFAVPTYGGGAGASVVDLRRILKERGGRLTSWFGVHMPQNAFYKSWERYDRLFEMWRTRLEPIARRVESRIPGGLPGCVVYNALLMPLVLLTTPLSVNFLRKLTDSPRGTPIHDLIKKADTGFAVTEVCTGCGICARVCPVGNIRMTDGKPQWLHGCENCIACYNYCPQKAITSKIAQKDYFYRHPDVKATEIMAQRGESSTTPW